MKQFLITVSVYNTAKRTRMLTFYVHGTTIEIARKRVTNFLADIVDPELNYSLHITPVRSKEEWEKEREERNREKDQERVGKRVKRITLEEEQIDWLCGYLETHEENLYSFGPQIEQEVEDMRMIKSILDYIDIVAWEEVE